jgi:hypothetical protein
MGVDHNALDRHTRTNSLRLAGPDDLAQRAIEWLSRVTMPVPQGQRSTPRPCRAHRHARPRRPPGHPQAANPAMEAIRPAPLAEARAAGKIPCPGHRWCGDRRWCRCRIRVGPPLAGLAIALGTVTIALLVVAPLVRVSLPPSNVDRPEVIGWFINALLHRHQVRPRTTAQRVTVRLSSPRL